MEKFSKITAKEKLYQGKWLSVAKISYTDRKGAKRDWEFCSRSSGVGAVMVIALTKPSNRVILVRQFRPPSESYMIEFPAGLIDDGEEISEAAHRELMEECGFCGKIVNITSPFFTSPGILSERVAFALMEIDENAPGFFVGTKFDDGEDIETFLVSLDDLDDFLIEREAMGDGIDAKLAMVALSIRFILPFAISSWSSESSSEPH